MLGHLINKIRTSKKISKAEIASKTGIDAGHIAHIEKGERTPSHKALKNISSALEIPYQQLMYTYDKNLSKEDEKYKIVEHIPYSSIPAVSSFSTLIPCPSKFGSANIAVKILDSAMEPAILKGSYAFIEFNSPLDNKDIGLFYYNNSFLLRRFIIRKNSLILKSDNPDFEDLVLSKDDKFYIIGKFLGTNEGF